MLAALRPVVTVAAKFIPLPIGPSSLLNVSKTNVVAKSDATTSVAHSTNPVALLKPVANTVSELPLLDVDFCGECLPFDQSNVVDRWKHVFSLFRPHAGDLSSLQQRAEAFFPIIEPILEKYEIPDDFRYIPLAESGLQARAVSRAGAAGYWQLMPGTARALGLKVGGRTDERFNVQKATEAACRYLRSLYDQLGSWSLVAAAYNVGPGFLKNQLKRQLHRDYYQMSWPRETRYYLYRVLLYKEVLSRPADYASFLLLTPAQPTAFQPWTRYGFQPAT